MGSPCMKLLPIFGLQRFHSRNFSPSFKEYKDALWRLYLLINGELGDYYDAYDRGDLKNFFQVSFLTLDIVREDNNNALPSGCKLE